MAKTSQYNKNLNAWRFKIFNFAGEDRLSSSGCLMIFPMFSGWILILGHLLVAKRMYHIWHVSFWGRFRTEKMPCNKTPACLASSIKVPTWPSDARVLKGKFWSFKCDRAEVTPNLWKTLLPYSKYLIYPEDWSIYWSLWLYHIISLYHVTSQQLPEEAYTPFN